MLVCCSENSLKSPGKTGQLPPHVGVTRSRLCPLNPKGDCKTYFSALFQALDWFPFCNSPIKGQSLVTVVVRLVGAFNRHVDVLGLFGRELGQLDTQLLEMEPRDLFVQLLG